MEGEDQGQAIWLVGMLDSDRVLNPARYSHACLQLSCATGHFAALDVLSEFMNAGWLYGIERNFWSSGERSEDRNYSAT